MRQQLNKIQPATGKMKTLPQTPGRARLRKGAAWTLAELKLLGTKPDSALALQFGRTREEIIKKREGLRGGLISSSQRWTSREILLLGTVTDAGLESVTGDQGRVLVAVTVKSADPAQAEQEPRFLRMRITVQKVGDGAKVSDVAFVS